MSKDNGKRKVWRPDFRLKFNQRQSLRSRFWLWRCERIIKKEMNRKR